MTVKRQSVLLIDDNPNERERKANILEEMNLVVVAPDYARGCDFHDSVLGLFRENRDIYDLLALDVQFGIDTLGGLNFYNKLVDGGYRNRWISTFLWTKNTYTDIAQAVFRKQDFDDSPYIVRLFCETAGIPYDHVWQTDHGGTENLRQKIRDILARKPDECCRFCGKEIGLSDS